MTRSAVERVAGIVPVAGLLVLWQATAAFGLVSPALLPGPAAVFARLVANMGDPTFLGHAAATGRRLAAGFGLALVIGVPLGILAARSRIAGAALVPLVRVLAPVPKIALYPALILTLGFDDASKIVLVTADALFPILLATMGGAGAVDPKLIWSARAAGTSAAGVLWRVVLPATVPAILTGSRIAIVVACIVVFLAEMITSTDGLGHLLIRATRAFATVDMFVPLIAISAIGLALNGALALLRRRLLRGYPTDA